MRKAIFLTVLLTVFLAFLVNSVYARSGCCSWHGGVCGCGCCDGSPLSAKCAPYYPWCNSPPTISFPTPTPIIIPESIKGGPTYHYNDSSRSYDVTFDWDDWSQSAGWSLGMSQYAGGDPGPNIDTTSSVWTFKNVYPGIHYVNIKASAHGYWSRISYWTIRVPALPTPTPTPTNTPTPAPTKQPTPTTIRKTIPEKQTDKKATNAKTIKTKNNFWNWIFGK